MGILRTDKISGLETPTAVTGSVVFDGTGDYVTSSAFHIADSWTMEFWFNTSVNNATQRPMNFSNNLNASNYAYIELGSSGNIKARVAGAAAFGSIDAPPVNQWHHTALSYDGSTAYFLLNGKLIASQSVSYSNHSIKVRFGADESNASSNLYTGYISNARIVSGEALYTADYTVPIHAFEATEGTNLLCFNNADSAAASEHGRPGAAPPTLTVTGDAAGSTFSPGLTRDFTYGTEFKGVTTFDTQGYFIPPSGTTEQRNLSGTRGLFAGSNPQPADGGGNTIEFITISTTGNSQDFGDRIGKGRRSIAAMSNHTRGVFGGSYGPSSTMGDTIDFVTIASTGNAVDFGDCLNDLTEATGISNNTRGIMAGGRTPTVHNVIQYITIPSLGNAIDFGDLLDATRNCASCQSPTRGLIGGGRTPTNLNVIQYVTIASTGNSIDFGDLTYGGGQGAMGGSNSIRGLFSGGFSPGASNAIEYVTIATTGNGQDFGDNTADTSNMNTMATSPTRACMFGADEPARTLSYVEIASTGNAQNFGSLYTDPTSNYSSGCSNGHGGLS